LPSAEPQPIRCVGAVIKDDAGRLLLVRRGHEPGLGLWSIPGGRVERGESDAEAVVREVLEETGLAVSCGPLLGRVLRPGLAGAVIEVFDFLAVVTGGELAAGDDAAEARWVTPEGAAALDQASQLTAGLLDALRSWSVLP
jgi:8-oxo-dGTP diphosphatase